MKDRIYLGRGGPGLKYGEGEAIYLEKHEWQCGWYWGFGYLGNKNLHFHFNSVLEQPSVYKVDEAFKSTWITQDQWWILRDLFIQAYAFQKAAECYRYGGHQSQKAELYRVKSKDMAMHINNNLRQVLNTIWALLHIWKSEETS